MHTLNVKAVDNYGHQYAVTLNPKGQDYVLRVETTGGSWLMSDLERAPRQHLYIDFGQDWFIVNFGEVLTAAKAALAGVPRLTAKQAQDAEDAAWARLIP